MTAQIANTINDVLEPQGAAVVIEATHQCMTTRGVDKPGSTLITSQMPGAFRDDASTRREFLSAIGNPQMRTGLVGLGRGPSGAGRPRAGLQARTMTWSISVPSSSSSGYF